MSINFEFLHHNRLLIIHFDDKFDIPEYMKFVEWLHAEYHDHAIAPIHSIMDMTAVRNLPPNVLSNGLRLKKLKHVNNGLIVLVTSDGMLSRIIESFVSLSRDSQFRFVKTVEAAIELLEEELMQEEAYQST